MWKYIGWRILVVALASLFVGAGATHLYETTKKASLRGEIVRLPGYEFISPLIACDIGQEEVFTELNPVRRAIAARIQAARQEGSARDVSVYMRMLNSARWLEVNDDIRYTPASLLKVFIMVGYLKEAEQDRGLLQERVYVRASDVSKQGGLIANRSYTVEELIREMIIKSNNDALHVLLEMRDVSSFEKIYEDLDIQVLAGDGEDRLDIMSPSAYSMVFRVLYGATYLDREMSEKALSILSEEIDTGGLASGLPEDVKAAHKFGLRRSEQHGEEVVELHDCGVIYYPGHPYILCVMTRGYADGTLHDVIADISRTAYEQVDLLFKDR